MITSRCWYVASATIKGLNMRTESRTLYLFGELSDSAKQKAIDRHRYCNVEDAEWWDCIYEAAERIGLKLTSFDLGCGSYCEGHFTMAGVEVAHAIIAEHGPDCETYKDAENYLKEYADLPLEEGEDVPSDSDIELVEREFLAFLLEDYRIMLQHEYDYLTSDETAAESLECNGVEFLEDGRRP